MHHPPLFTAVFDVCLHRILVLLSANLTNYLVVASRIATQTKTRYSGSKTHASVAKMLSMIIPNVCDCLICTYVQSESVVSELTTGQWVMGQIGQQIWVGHGVMGHP